MLLAVTFVLFTVGIPATAPVWVPRRVRAWPRQHIDNWLLRNYGLLPPEQEEVRAAVLEGRQVRSPELAVAANDLATRLRGKEIKLLPWGRLLLPCIALTSFALLAIGWFLISSHRIISTHYAAWHASGLLCGLASGLLAAVINTLDGRVRRIRKDAAIALELGQDSLPANSADMDFRSRG